MVTCYMLEESVGYPKKLGWWHKKKNPPFMAVQAEESNPVAENAGLVSLTQENNSSWIRLLYCSAPFQMEAGPDSCEYDQ